MCTIITMHRVSVLYCYNNIIMVGNNIIIQPVASHGTYIIVLRRARVYNNYYYFLLPLFVLCMPATTNEIGTYLPVQQHCYTIIIIVFAVELPKNRTIIPKCLRMHREP